jgi:phosphate-selective porin OprO/OprP
MQRARLTNPATSWGLVVGAALLACLCRPMDASAQSAPAAPLVTFGHPEVAPEGVAAPKPVSGEIAPLLEVQPAAKPVVELRGRINTDAILVGQSARDQAILGEIPNATGFRRAYLGVQGTVGEQVDWVAEFDFAGGVITFKDVFIGLEQLPIIRRVRVGHFLEPFSLEELTNSNFFALVEYSPIVALGPGRNWGVGIFSYTDDERATFQTGAFRTGSNSAGDDFSTGNDMAYDVRITGLPWYEADGRYLLHLGGAFSQRYPYNQVVAIDQSPQSSLLTSLDNPGSAFIPKISVPASQQQLFNLQSALVLGPLSFQAEWSATQIDQIGGGPVWLHGSYVFASLFLTGENRDYLTKDGVFGMPHVRSPFLCLKGAKYLAGGPGAWELTARFAYADFASGNIPPVNGLKVGDRDAEFTLGVNWYLNDFTRLMFNYVHSVPVDPNFGPSYANTFYVRTAIFW